MKPLGCFPLVPPCPKLSGCTFFAPPDAPVVFPYNYLLCKDTCSVAGSTNGKDATTVYAKMRISLFSHCNNKNFVQLLLCERTWPILLLCFREVPLIVYCDSGSFSHHNDPRSNPTPPCNCKTNPRKASNQQYFMLQPFCWTLGL